MCSRGSAACRMVPQRSHVDRRNQHMRVSGIAGAALLLGVTLSTVADAQRRNPFGGQYLGSPDEFYQPPDFHGNPHYDGRFTFARIKYRGFRNWAGAEGPGWSHDYPRAEYDFVRILRDVTSVRPFTDEGPIVGSVIVALDDPLLFKYPVS